VSETEIGRGKGRKMRKGFCGLVVFMLLMSTLTLALNIQPVRAIGTITIRADGSIDPPTASISTVDNVTYFLTDSVNGSILVERSNIIINGSGYSLQGSGNGSGISTTLPKIVLGINDIQIQGFSVGISLKASLQVSGSVAQSNITNNGVGIEVNSGRSAGADISANNIVNNSGVGIYVSESSDHISGNNIANNGGHGIYAGNSYCYISGNNITGNGGDGINFLNRSSGGVVFENNISDNKGYGIILSGGGPIFHNNFKANGNQAFASGIGTWDNGYPSGGNYWSDYTGVDFFSGPYQNESGSDGIGDTSYVIDQNNTDRYPLKSPYSPPDIATVRVMPYATTVYPPSPVFVSTTIENRGNKSEFVTVNLYANTAVIGTKNITVQPCTNLTLTTIWNTVGFAGEYNISAYAWPLEDEIDILNNRLSDGYVDVMGKGYFIVVAGNRYDNALLSTINYGCNQVYKILRQVGYSADNIYYLNQPECGYQDLDGDGKNDIDAWASNTNLRWAIETWAANRTSPTQPLYLYLFDHGGSDIFGINNAPEILHSWQLASWLDNLEQTTGAPIHVIYAACHSGSFIDELSRAGRVVVTSSSADEFSWTIPGTWEAFSTPFWNQIKSGHSILASFNYASSPLSLANWFLRFIYWLKGMHQTPLLDDNGDCVGHAGYLPNGGDGYLANNIYIGACEWPYPWINQTMPSLFGYWPPTSNTTLWAKIENNTNLLHVRAYMVPPDWKPPNSTDTLIALGTECYEMMDPEGDGNWTVDIPAANFTNHAPETAPNANFTFFITAEQDNGDMATPFAINIWFSETPDLGIDEISPWVSIERPWENRIVSNIITVNGTAVDDVCLEKIEVCLDGNLCGTIDLPNASSSFYEFNLDTTLFENGNRTILVRVFDMADNSYNQTLNVVFDNFAHEIAVTNVAATKNIVGQGFASDLLATIANHGSYYENVNLSLYANESLIASQTLFLSNGNYTALIFNWNTTGFAKGNYTVIAHVEPLPGELNTEDNNMTSLVALTIPGDLNGDFTVDIYDAILLAGHFNQTPINPLWSANVDINGDNIVDIYDAIILANHYNQSYP
jgi:parallel beta-helix repeat protein